MKTQFLLTTLSLVLAVTLCADGMSESMTATGCLEMVQESACNMSMDIMSGCYRDMVCSNNCMIGFEMELMGMLG